MKVFSWTITYQKSFVFSVYLFCSQVFTLILNLIQKMGLTYAISIVNFFFFFFEFSSKKHFHYENTPIYGNFTSKSWKFSDTKNSDIFHISTHNLCFWAEIRKITYTPVNPSFTIQKRGLRASKLHRRVFVILLFFADLNYWWLTTTLWN